MRLATTATVVLLAGFMHAQAGESLSPEVLLAGHEKADAYAPCAAFGGGVYLVAWQAGRDEDTDIVAARVDASGKVLDAKPIVLCAAKDDQSLPRVAFGGGKFLVVWQDLRGGKDYDLYAARVSPEGKILDPDGVAVSAEKGNQCQPAICFDGSAFQILWRDFRNGGDYDIFGGRVSPAGKLLDGTGVLVQKRVMGTFTCFAGPPGVGSNASGQVLGAAYLGWSKYGKQGVWPMRGGKRTGKHKLLEGRKVSSHDSAFASDGKNLLMVFTCFRPKSRGGSTKNSGAWLYGADGAPLGGMIAVSSTGSPVRNPSPAWDGKSYVVAWDMPQGDSRRGYIYDTVLLRRVSKDGKGQGADTLVAGEKGSPAYRPAAASDGKGTTLVAYERHPKTADVPIKIAFRMLKGK